MIFFWKGPFFNPLRFDFQTVRSTDLGDIYYHLIYYNYLKADRSTLSLSLKRKTIQSQSSLGPRFDSNPMQIIRGTFKNGAK